MTATPKSKRGHVEQVTQSVWQFAQQLGTAPFVAGANESALDYMRKTQDTVVAMTKLLTGSMEVGQKFVADNQRRAEVVLHQIADNARTNADAAFDACAAVAKARSVPDLFLVQAHFMQDQVAALARQSHDLVGLALDTSQPNGRNGRSGGASR
jgi:hypothetical protein